MKYLVLSMLLVFGFGRQGVAAEGKVVRVNVSGLVCGFCASKVESNFKKTNEVEKVTVHLDENLEDKINDSHVLLKFKPGKEISNEEIKKSITSAGFDVVSIVPAN